MQIFCNGQQREVSNDFSLLELLKDLELPPDSVVAELNKKIIERDQLDAVRLQEGDQVELIRFVGGG